MQHPQVPVAGSVLRWAARRSDVPQGEVESRFPQLNQWERGAAAPTYEELHAFASFTHTPFGSFFLEEPPAESMPIPDFRTMGNGDVGPPSSGLLDVIYICQERQDWYRQYLISQEMNPLNFVGSASIGQSISDAAQDVRNFLDYSLASREMFRDQREALRYLTRITEDQGILVMMSGMVGDNTHRLLDPVEFRGFALVDDRAPLIFINGADTQAARIFTLVHEICHVFLGESGVSDSFLRPHGPSKNAIERWCNRVAGEVLVPLESLRHEFHGSLDVLDLERLAGLYMVSTLVVLNRLHDGGLVEWDSFRSAYSREVERIGGLLGRKKSRSGGNYYNVKPLRVSRKFASALINDTLRGRTLYGTAYHLLDTKRSDIFDRLGRDLGIM